MRLGLMFVKDSMQ